MALKWMLCFEEPETRTLWLAKATPRDWLAAGEAPLVASNLTTRYGRLSFSLAPPVVVARGSSYAVRVNLTLPPSFATTAPAGGIRLRLRAPLAYAGRLSAVTVGTQQWSDFSAAEETIDIAASQLSASVIQGLTRIVATFDYAEGSV